MRESFAWVRNKITDKFTDVYSAYRTKISDKMSATALAVQKRMPDPVKQAYGVASRFFTSDTREFIQHAPETQRVFKIAFTANFLWVSTYLMYAYNNYLLSAEVDEDEFTLTRHLRYTANAMNFLLWLGIVRKSIRMLALENPIYGSMIYNSMLIDHPNGHYQLDCKLQHPELIKLPQEDISFLFHPYAAVKKKLEDYQHLISEYAYIVKVALDGVASNVYYVVDSQAIKLLTQFLPYGPQVAFLLNAFVAGHSLPEYNYGYQCTQHRHEQTRKLNLASVTIAGMYVAFVEALTYALGGGWVANMAAATVVYHAFIPVIMSKPFHAEKEGRDYFYYNRAITNSMIGFIARELTFIIKEKEPIKIKEDASKLLTEIENEMFKGEAPPAPTITSKIVPFIKQEGSKAALASAGFLQSVFLVDDFAELVRMPVVRMWMDNNEAKLRVAVDVIKYIRESNLIKAGNEVSNWVAPANLEMIKKVLELILTDKAEVAKDILEDLLSARKEYESELEALGMFRQIHEPEKLAQVLSKTEEELNPKEPEQTVQLHVPLTIIDNYEDKELAKKQAIAPDDEDELFKQLPKTNKKVSVSSDLLDFDLSDGWTEFTMNPPPKRNNQVIRDQKVSEGPVVRFL